MRRIIALAIIALLFVAPKLNAKEGMWLPLLLQQLNEADMQSMGLKLSAEEIYSVNQSSLKDAVISFGGFCTGEVISDQGLILTNHHCGYRSIQSHSSVENDYLTEGYWAMQKTKELPNEGLTATFIISMADVTKDVLAGTEGLKGSALNEKINENIRLLNEQAAKGTHYKAIIKPFYYGNEYYQFVTETFKDVRLVGAPPSSIGKFGGDTDNWIWPRHTGDFSLFRIYADKNNQPAAYSEDNVPFKPRHAFPISMKGVKKGDFTMVFGFPGRTQEYLTSYAVDMIRNKVNPASISIREEALATMDRHMKASDEVRIKYAAKYASVSNYWKKWKGENRGLDKANAIAEKQKQEKAFMMAAAGKEEYKGLLAAFEKRYKELETYAVGRAYFIEIPYRRIELFSLAANFRSVVAKASKGEAIEQKDIDRLKSRIQRHFKDYDEATDKALFEVLMKKYETEAPLEFQPADAKDSWAKYKGDFGKYADAVYGKTMFTDQEKLEAMLSNFNASAAKKVKKDPAYFLMSEFVEVYLQKIRPKYNQLSDEVDSLSKVYVKGLRALVKDRYYPDANSTLRLAYGQVDDYLPRDGVHYDFFTDTEGILEKYQPGHADFDLPPRLIELIESGDFGPYKDDDGSMHVCFTASNHTTGGNSGSPVINAEGQLIGLNFDRNWEGTMSDIMYDPNQCRNISVDIRYVLFVVDRFANAGHLVKEMNLVE